ncbi:MAG: hypothetical protein U9P42_01890 [Candidatus Fermentibacteria bacterium]|nr:hypothetical protein [Candidatus Fermentibacteria bacterium]
MVGLLVLLLFGAGDPFEWECPTDVQSGESFSLRITCAEPGCSGISTGTISTSPGVNLLGSSTSTSISSVTSATGRQLTQTVVLEVFFSASGGGSQTIGPIQLNLHGIGTYTLNEISLSIDGSTGTTTSSGSTAVDLSQPDEDVWLTGELHDPGGRIYPGTRLFLDYYVYSRVNVENVTYWWSAPELGAIINIETIPDSNWESADLKHDTVNRSLLAVIEMVPAAAGSLLAPVFRADITGSGYDRWGKVNEWTIESAPVMLPVFPFPENPPDHWEGSLFDSVAVSIEQLPAPPGQGGELPVRVTCTGPGSVYMNEPPVPTLHGNANLLAVNSGSAGNKKWWDFVLEPEETGYCVLGPDSIVWLNRRSYSYRNISILPCTLYVASIPWADREIELSDADGNKSPLCWVTAGGIGIIVLTVLLVVTVKKRDKELASVAGSSDADELLTVLEGELSRLLTGKKQYLGYEELDALLDRCNIDSFLARRILRFWRDLEQSLSDREISESAFGELKTIAEELLYNLRKDLKSNYEKE